MAMTHYLLTNSSQQEFLTYMADVSPMAETESMVEVWRSAQAAMDRIRDRESGCADLAAVLPLPSEMAPQATAVCESAQVNQAHQKVPVAFGLVQFDALMTVRKTLSDAKLETVRATVRSAPDDAELAQICLSLSSPPVQARTTRWDGQRMLVVTEAEDIRLLRVDAIPDLPSEGTTAPGVPLTTLKWVFGRTLPVMHAVQFDGRVLLVKGHHRAHVLKSLGVNYLPCLISACESLEDVSAAAPAIDRSAAEKCFSQDRPPMLGDFGRSAFTHRHEAPLRQRMLEFRVEITSHWLPPTGN